MRCLKYLKLIVLSGLCISGILVAQPSSTTESSVTSMMLTISSKYKQPEPNHDISFTSGDYNGDGSLDIAFIALTPGDEFWSLNVYFGSKNDLKNDTENIVGQYVSLKQHTPSVTLDEIKLSTATKDTFKAFCNYTSDGCTEGQPDVLKIINDSIYLQIVEASISVLYWDPVSGSFKRLWLSD